MARTVYCVKLGRELPGLERPPFPGELGQRIYEHISKQAYDMWQAESTNVINERGLSMGDPEARKVLRQEMEKFFFSSPKQPAGQGATTARVVGAAKGPRLVYCVKLGRELPGLARPPMPGELGQRIYEQISQQAYDMWEAQRTLIINHYQLNLADPESRKILREQMEEFFFGSDAQMPEGWVPEAVGAGASDKGGGGAASSKGGGGGAPSSKGGGGGAAQRK
jgi:Fe-S cluster biosynthesis and repair protein YggX